MKSQWSPSFLHTAIITALSSGLINAPAMAETSTPSAAERITVTGSFIKRNQHEDATPLQIIDADAIAATGEVTLSDVLRSISVSTGNSFDEQYTSSFSAGSASVGLRGLSPKNTLVLVNGQRVANYGFALGTQDTFVDLNALPLSAIARIEVLKDGASSVYGSDAIAGVVNIILQDNVQQTSVKANYGAATQGSLDQFSASLLTGFGDVYDEGYQLTLSYSYLTRERLDASERDFSRDGDFRHLPGGRLTGWSTGGGNYLDDPQNPRPFETCAGEAELRDRSDFTPGAEGQICAFNGQAYNTLQPKVERHQLSLQGKVQLADDWLGFSEVLYSNNRSSLIFGSPLSIGAGLRAYDQETGTLVNIPVEFPVGHPANSGTEPLPFDYAFFDLGAREKANKQDFYRVVAGVRYEGLDWNASFQGVQSQSRQREYVQNFVNRYTFEQVLADGSYDFLGGENSADVIDALRINTRRPGFYELQGLNFNASTIVSELAHGPLSVAFGADWRRESMDAGTSPEVLSGTELRPAINLIKGERDIVAGFVEVDLPVIADGTISAAARYDRYDDFGSAWSPKVAFHYLVADDWLVRAAWSRGFRAPSLPEIADSNTISYSSVIDPFDPIEPGVRRGFTQIRSGNSELEAERSTHVNAGIIWSPSHQVNIALDLFQIEQDGIIAADNAQFIVSNPDIYGDRIQRDAAGRLQIITNQYRNQGTRTTTGFDIDFSYQRELAEGQLKLQSTWSHLLDYKQALVVGQEAINGAGNNLFGALPEWKGQTQVRWQRDAWQLGFNANYTSSYVQKVATSASNPGLDAKVEHFWDLGAQVVYHGLANTQVTLGVQNLLDQDPPFDPAGGAYGYDMTQYNLRGRTINLGVSYTF